MNTSLEELREKFTNDLLNSEDAKLSKYNVMSRWVYEELLQEIKEAKLALKKTSLQYRRVNRFDILEICGVERIIAKSKGDEVLYFLPVEEIFDVIMAAHIEIGHGGRDRLRMETSRKYANITIKMINLFLSMCEVCSIRKGKKKKELVSKPILHSELNSQCRIDLIDMQSQTDGEYKFIMVYQDHQTRFVLLRPLTSKQAEEIACKLVEIFLTFGAPCILHCDESRELATSIIKELKSLWPELKVVHGKPHNSQSEGLDQTNQDIKDMITEWMADNKNVKWSEGLPFVQFMKNCSFHSGIKQSPYKAMFGTEPRVGLTTSSLPNNIISSLEREEDLEKVLEDVENNMAETVGEDSNIECDGREEKAKELKSRLCSKCNAVIDANFDGDYCLNCTVRYEASQSLIPRAKKIKSSSYKTHPPGNIGNNVTISLPNINRLKDSCASGSSK